MNDPYEFADHLGDGVYVKYTGYSYEISVNDHRNPVVVEFSPEAIEAFMRFKKRMEDV